MNEHSAELEQILEQELAIHEKLVVTARSMNAALREDRSVAEIQAVSQLYDACTCHIEELEEKRLAACDAVAADLGLPGRHVNISAIIQAIGPEASKRLAELRHRLKSTIGDLAQVNTSNRVLLQESLIAIQKTVEIVRQSRMRSTGYQPRGQKMNESITHSMFNQVV